MIVLNRIGCDVALSHRPASATSIVIASMNALVAWDWSGDKLELEAECVGRFPAASRGDQSTSYPQGGSLSFGVFLKRTQDPSSHQRPTLVPRLLRDLQARTQPAGSGHGVPGKRSRWEEHHRCQQCLDNAGPVLTRDEWFDVFRDIAEGLKAIHDKGFQWNDLKEDNVALVKKDGSWRAKLIDFGWARDISSPLKYPMNEEMKQKYRTKMAYNHIAPECVLEDKPCSTASDVYALGRLLAVVGQEFSYDDFENYGRFIMIVHRPESRPTVQEFIDRLYYMHLTEGGEDGPGTSSC